MIHFLRTCSLCGATLPPVHYVCRYCWQRLCSRARSRRTRLDAFQIHHLWTWHGYADEMGVFLKRRKCIHDRRGEERLAQLLFTHIHALENQCLKYVVFPTKQWGMQDHTWRLAYRLSQLLGLQMWPVPLVEVSNYKHLSRRMRLQERKLRQGGWRGPLIKEGEALIFDDVMTTGTTLKTVWQGAGEPNNPVIVCLAYKSFRPEDKN